MARVPDVTATPIEGPGAEPEAANETGDTTDATRGARKA
jgi:hypothetical protein